ncbi:MAG: UDP-N-acetylmuramyl-tripeptide synthetase [bacterium]
MEYILNKITKMAPKKILDFIRPVYHKTLAHAASFWYRYPSEKMIVIGVTGTKGKTTTVKLIAEVLKASGEKVGFLSTAEFQIGDKRWLNDKKMTMLGRFQLQKMLREMVNKNCRYAVIETSSEGVKQFRHIGINYDYLVFTNLTPEHIESHGSFEKYKNAKLGIFKKLNKSKHKIINGEKVEKVIIVNRDDKFAEEFWNCQADKKFGFSALDDSKGNFCAKEVLQKGKMTSFKVRETEFNLKLLGLFNVYNSLPAIIIGESEGLKAEKIKVALENIEAVPGRMEFIEEGQPFYIIVDYAHEPNSMQKLFESIKIFCRDKNINRIIHVFGSTGGGRDKSRRPVLGRISGENADVVIVTNDDPYDDDPMEIINEVASGAEEIKKLEIRNLKDGNRDEVGGKRDSVAHGKSHPDSLLKGDGDGKSVFKILDRREAIRKAVELAKAGDLVLITGKGAEQAMCVADGKKIAWDDRKVARLELARLELRSKK